MSAIADRTYCPEVLSALSITTLIFLRLRSCGLSVASLGTYVLLGGSFAVAEDL